jgi:DNA-binding transcriptional LysR family regulator
MPEVSALNWDDLRFFLLAARAGTLAGAARAAGVQHTTIGRRLSALERSLGVPLFLRGPEGLTLTSIGEQLLPLAQKAERSMQAVHEFVASRCNRVRLALPTGFIALFADELERFGREHPELILETVSGSQLADLRHGQADLALRIGPIDDPDLVARPLGDVGSSLYASPHYLKEHPVRTSPLDVSGHRLVAFGAELSTLPAARWIEEHAVQSTIALRTNEMVSMLEAAASGAGLAVLPCMLADADARLARLTPQVLARRALSLVYRREQRGNRPVRLVVSFLMEALRLRADRISGTSKSAVKPAAD